jgi:predicted NAD/FAD-binding protein
LKRAIRIVERAGLSVVQISRRGDAIYMVAGNGEYRRFDKVKKP